MSDDIIDGLIQRYKMHIRHLEPAFSKNLQAHVNELASASSIRGMTFMFVTNVSTQKYIHFTENTESCVGINIPALLEGGVPYVMSRVHPDDIHVWSEMLAKVFEYVYTEPPADRLKLSFQFNYRFQHGNGQYINLVDNEVALELDDEGKPFMFMGQVTVVGGDEPIPLRVSVSRMNDLGIYDLVFTSLVDSSNQLTSLGKREIEVLKLMAEGHNSKDIARHMFISPQTVDRHRKNILKKLEVKNAVSAALRAKELRII